MSILQGDDLFARFSDVLHRETQDHENSIHLTAGMIYRITSGGQLDFGGSEFENAEYSALEPEKKNPDDSYGWWFLDEGTYRVKYNEALQPEDGEIVVVQPLARILEAGVYHPSFHVDNAEESPITLLQVGEGGVDIKENARISSARILA